jgi:hypothetical protein
VSLESRTEASREGVPSGSNTVSDQGDAVETGAESAQAPGRVRVRPEAPRPRAPSGPWLRRPGLPTWLEG